MSDFRAVIASVRDGEGMTPEQCDWVARASTDGTVPDYQLAAWLMAVYIRGLDAETTFHLTDAMARSGGPPAEHLGRVDKHSTGGVGDKTTLVVGPLVSSFGVPVAKMSGRGLGHTGGTLDKLESIPGFRVDWSKQEFSALVARVGLAVAAQSSELAPADGRLYALRDVTGTVDSLPLIASSIMSKKMAGGAPALVLDVKVGQGAFMRDRARAETLARLMLEIASRAGIRAAALLTNMDQPLGYAVGNAAEVNEAVDTLRGAGPADFTSLSVAVASEMLRVAGEPEAHPASVQKRLASGQAFEKFLEWIRAQGGDSRVFERDGHLPLAPVHRVWEASRGDQVARIDPRLVGEAALLLGAGRRVKTDRINPRVGVKVYVKTGMRVDAGTPVAEVFGEHPTDVEAARALLQQAVTWGEPVRHWPTILATLPE